MFKEFFPDINFPKSFLSVFHRANIENDAGLKFSEFESMFTWNVDVRSAE